MPIAAIKSPLNHLIQRLRHRLHLREDIRHQLDRVAPAGPWPPTHPIDEVSVQAQRTDTSLRAARNSFVHLWFSPFH